MSVTDEKLDQNETKAKIRDLTPEEMRLLDEMSCDNGMVSQKCQRDEFFQRKLLGGMLTDPAMSSGISLVSDTFWSLEAHAIAYNILLQFWGEYGELPTKYIVMEKLKSQLADRDAAIQLMYTTEIAAVYEYFCPGLTEPQYLLGELQEWAKVQAIALTYSDYAEGKESGKSPNEIIDAIINRLNDVKKMTISGSLSETWGDTQAKREQEQWLIPNWIEFGSLGMLSGNPFAGKSHIMAEIMAAIFSHGFFARYKVVPCPVLLFDAENKRRIIVKRLDNALAGNTGQTGKLFRRIDIEKITLPMPLESAAETLRQLIRQTKQATGYDRCFVIVDTLRSVLGADEMDNDQMKGLLYPLQRMAQEEDAALLILMHRPKSGAAYSGQSSIPGACDFQWLWESDKDTGVGKLTLEGTRGDREKPLHFVLRNGRNEWVPDSEVQQAASADQSGAALIKLLEHILQGIEMNQTELVKHVRNLWTASEVPAINVLRTMIDSLVGTVLNRRKGKVPRELIYSLMAIACVTD